MSSIFRYISCWFIFGVLWTASHVSAEGWTIRGPGGGGAMFLPTVNPHDSRNVILRSDMTGTFITRDGGESWEIENFLNPANAFAFDPEDAATLHVAGIGLWRTEDAGENWRLVFPRPQAVTRVDFIGDHADPVFILSDGSRSPQVTAVRGEADGSILIALEDGTLRLSDDAGASWSVPESRLEEAALAIFPGSWWEAPGEWLVLGASEILRLDRKGAAARSAFPDSPVLMVRGGHRSGQAFLYAITEEAVLRSTDRGATWIVDEAAINSYEGITFRSLAVSEQHPEVAYVGVHSRPFGIIKTTNGGESWDWVYRVDPAPNVADYRITVGDYQGAWMDAAYGPEWREDTFGLGAGATDPDVCYATDYGAVYRTIDGGITWRQLHTRVVSEGRYATRGADVTNCLGIHFDPFDPDHILTNYNDIGTFASQDGGQTWSHAVNGIPRGVHVGNYWILFDPDVQGRVWSTWGSRHDLPRHKMFRHGRFLQGARGGVAVSDNGGGQWRMLDGLPGDAVCTHIVLDPRSPQDARTLYVSAFQKGIYRSDDGGSSWRRLPHPPSGSNRNYWRLALSPDGNLYVLVVRDREGTRWIGTEYPGGLFRSRDGGESWEVVSLPRGYDFPNDLIFDPAEPQRMFLSMWPGDTGTGLDNEALFGGGLLRSDDGGESWQQIFDPHSYVFATEIDPDNPRRLFLVTFEGAAFHSDDGGESWSRIEGYDFKWGQRPKLDPRDPDKLFITTFGGGLWHGPASGTASRQDDSTWFDPRWRWTHPSIKVESEVD